MKWPEVLNTEPPPNLPQHQPFLGHWDNRRSQVYHTTLKASNFGIETFAPPTNGPNFIAFWLFLATKMSIARPFENGVKKTRPLWGSLWRVPGMMWGELAIRGCLIGSLRGESLPCIDLNSVFLSLQVVNTSINMKKHLDQTRQGDVSLEKSNCFLGLSCSKVILENTWRDDEGYGIGLHPLKTLETKTLNNLKRRISKLKPSIFGFQPFVSSFRVITFFRIRADAFRILPPLACATGTGIYGLHGFHPCLQASLCKLDDNQFNGINGSVEVSMNLDFYMIHK